MQPDTKKLRSKAAEIPCFSAFFRGSRYRGNLGSKSGATGHQKAPQKSCRDSAFFRVVPRSIQPEFFAPAPPKKRCSTAADGRGVSKDTTISVTAEAKVTVAIGFITGISNKPNDSGSSGKV